MPNISAFPVEARDDEDAHRRADHVEQPARPPVAATVDRRVGGGAQRRFHHAAPQLDPATRQKLQEALAGLQPPQSTGSGTGESGGESDSGQGQAAGHAAEEHAHHLRRNNSRVAAQEEQYSHVGDDRADRLG